MVPRDLGIGVKVLIGETRAADPATGRNGLTMTALGVPGRIGLAQVVRTIAPGTDAARSDAHGNSVMEIRVDEPAAVTMLGAMMVSVALHGASVVVRRAAMVRATDVGPATVTASLIGVEELLTRAV